MSGIHRREMTIGGDGCLLGFSGREWVGSAVFDPTFLTPGGVNEVQTITITGGPTGGTFTLTFKDEITTALAFNATAAAVEDALQALGRIGDTGVTVTGSAGGPYTVTFGGRHANKDVELILASDLLTGGTTPEVVVTEATKGSSKHAGLYVLEGGLPLTYTDDGKRARPYTGEDNVNEVQVVTISGAPTGGTFRLTYRGEQTGTIAFNAAASAVQTALEGLDNIDAGDVTVTGSAGGPYTVTFTGDLGGAPQPLMTGQSQLTGGTNPAVTVAQSVAGAEVEQIIGIFDGRAEFMDNTELSAKPVPVYGHNAVFNKAKVKGYTAHQEALERWARTVGAEFKSQALS